MLAGSNVTFSVTGGGSSPLSYQWQFNGVGISGKTNSSLTVSNVSLANAGNYQVGLGNAYNSVTSSVAVLTVLDPPVISSQPASLTNYAGTLAAFNVTASALGGTPVNFQWLKDGVPLANGGNISGVTSSTLSLINVTRGDADSYSVVITNSYGAVTSAVVTLTIRTTVVADSFNIPWNSPLQFSPGQLLTNDVAGSANGSNTNLSFLSLSSSSVNGGAIQSTTTIAVVWANRYAAASNLISEGWSIAVDGSNDVIVVGVANATNGAGLATLKYSNSGLPLWTNRYVPTDGGFVGKVALDRDGDIYVFGGQYKFYTLKYSKSRVPLWTNIYTSPFVYDRPVAVATDTNKDVFVTGLSQRSNSVVGFITIKYSSAGAPLWTNIYAPSIAGYGSSEPAALVVDPSGNVIVAGFTDTNSTLAAPAFAVVKYSSAGALLWVRQYNAVAHLSDKASSVATDTNGTVFVHGSSYRSDGFYDYATVAYSSAGVPLWSNRFQAHLSGVDSPGLLALDKLGNVLTVGSYSDGGLHGSDIVAVKYSGGGVPLWTNYYNNPWNFSGDYPAVLTLDTNGSAIIAGFTSIPGNTNYPLTMAVSSNGAPVWSQVYSNAGNAISRGVAADASGNVFTIGSPYSGSSFLTIKYAPTTAYIYTPPVNFIGVDSFNYMIQDGLGIMATGTVSVVGLPPSIGFNQLFGQYRGDVGMLLAYAGVAGSNYVLEGTFNLAPPAIWLPLATNVGDSSGYVVFISPPNPATNNFWRIRSVP